MMIERKFGSPGVEKVILRKNRGEFVNSWDCRGIDAKKQGIIYRGEGFGF